MLYWSEPVLSFSRGGRHCRSTASACKTFCSQPPPYGLVLRAADHRPYILIIALDPVNTIAKNLLHNMVCSVGPCRGHSQLGARTKVFVWFVAENNQNCAQWPQKETYIFESARKSVPKKWFPSMPISLLDVTRPAVDLCKNVMVVLSQ